MDYEELFQRLFKEKDMKERIRQTGYSYVDAMFGDDTLTYEKLISFINKYKNELIECALNDNILIENLLYEDGVVDTTKKSLITKEYLEELMNDINNKEFKPKALTFYLYLMHIHNLFANKYDENTLKEILNLNIVSILDNPHILTEDGDTLLEKDKKLELTDKLLAWNKKCGKEILPYIFQLETLKEYITELINSNQVRNNKDYENKLLTLLKICEYSIVVRDTDIIPTPEELKQINNLFSNYDSINKSIIIDSINTGSVTLVHFIRDNEVDYQLVGEEIIDMSGKNNNNFDSDQSDFFIRSYYEYVISTIEEQTGKKFDMNDLEMRKLLKEKITHFNNIINNKPLDRLPIKKRETSHNLRTYLRETDSRLSCSFVPNLEDMPATHLDRKIGLIIRPTKAAILSTSLGYTSEKSFYDFKKDSMPCTETFSKLTTKQFVNETCVDASQCEVVGVLLLSNEKDIVERAEKVAAAYNVEIIRVIQKNNMETMK